MPVLRSLLNGFASIRNAFDYPLRQFFHLSRAGLSFHNQSKANLFADLTLETGLPDATPMARQAEARLRTQYHLQPLYDESGVDNYCENLFYLEMLEHSLQKAELTLPAVIDACDIGPSHWFYVQALYAGLCWWQQPEGRQVTLTGYEADPYRVYNDLRSRYDHARAHIRNLPQVHFIPQAFQIQPGKFDLVMQFFPFILLPDHLDWGLPRPMFVPQALLRSAWGSLKAGGVLLIINQGLHEYEVQQQMLAELQIPVQTTLCHESLLYHYDLERMVTVCCHE